MRAAQDAGETDYQVDPFVYPYDLGCRNNFAQVLNVSCMPIGDGVEWPVVDGCDQYTLTVRIANDTVCNKFKFSTFLARTISSEGRETSKNAALSNHLKRVRQLDAALVARVQSVHSPTSNRRIPDSVSSRRLSERNEVAKALAVW